MVSPEFLLAVIYCLLALLSVGNLFELILNIVVIAESNTQPKDLLSLTINIVFFLYLLFLAIYLL